MFFNITLVKRNSLAVKILTLVIITLLECGLFDSIGLALIIVGTDSALANGYFGESQPKVIARNCGDSCIESLRQHLWSWPSLWTLPAISVVVEHAKLQSEIHQR